MCFKVSKGKYKAIWVPMSLLKYFNIEHKSKLTFKIPKASTPFPSKHIPQNLPKGSTPSSSKCIPQNISKPPLHLLPKDSFYLMHLNLKLFPP